VRRLLVAVTLGLVVLVGAPTAHAADYPPKSPGIGIPSRPTPAGQPTGAGGLPATGSNNLGNELGIGAGLIVAGGTILVVTRRRRSLRG
jgi:LPXTG-motif cell wall-anchored protein